MWFRVAEYHTFFSPKDGLKSVIINFFLTKIFIIFPCGLSLQLDALRKMGTSEKISVSLCPLYMHRIVLWVHMLPALGFKTSYVDVVFGVSEAMAAEHLNCWGVSQKDEDSRARN